MQKLVNKIIIFPETVSRKLVASSKKSISGFLIIALAIATLCCSPPESTIPLSPTRVSYPSGSFFIN